jgi:hypothetical protein
LKSFITIAFFSLFIADLFGQQTDPETLYSRKDGAFGVFSTWSTQSHEGAIAETTPGCSITGERSVVVADSIVTLCDRILISGNSNLVVANGGKLFLKGGLEVLGKSSVTVEKRGALYVGRNLIVSGDAKFKLDGDLTVNGNVEVNGHGFACGKGFSRLGGSVSGIGWCLDLNVLPIEILSIDARLEADEDVLLYWTSSIASETDDFIIERSNNGMSFVQIARVDGSTGGANETPYAYQDKGLKTGTYYYRLTQVDKTGGKEAEEIIAATIDRNMETGLCEL